MSKLYIVTGCAGFIGYHVSRRLLHAGDSVLGIDDVNDSTDPRIKRWRLADLLPNESFDFLEADISNPATSTEISTRTSQKGLEPAAVINLAGRAGVQKSVDEPQTYVNANVSGTLNMMDLCRTLDVQKFVSASTSSVYGDSTDGPVSEDSVTDRPLSPYAATKKATEVLAHSYHHIHGLDVSMLRFFTVYGPAGRTDMSVLRFIRWIANGEPVVLYGDGSQERDFTNVGDISRGVIAALMPTGFEAINLGSDKPVTVNTLIGMIESHVGRKAMIEHRDPNPADVRATWADVSKARCLLRWTPEVSLDQGISETVEWYLSNRELVDSLDLGMSSSGSSS